MTPALLRFLIVCSCVLAWGQVATAQANVDAKPTGSQSGWTSECTSLNRQAQKECSVRQNLFLKKTGQLVGSVTVRVPADTQAPVIMIQTPLDLFLPAGVTLSVDGGNPVPFVLQTCNVKGCYAGAKLPNALLFGFLKGQRLNIVFEDLNKQKITLPMPLAGFNAAYQTIR